MIYKAFILAAALFLIGAVIYWAYQGFVSIAWAFKWM